MIDICDGNISEEVRKSLQAEAVRTKPRGNFRMCGYPTNPIRYAQDLGIDRLWRFILTHPDMDHMDGLNALVRELGTNNFWDAGVERDAPDFSSGPFEEADWDRYISLRDGKESGVTSLRKLADARFQMANRELDGQPGGDGLYILAPNSQLVATASEGSDINDGSYVLLYRSAGGRVLIPGDAHDATWQYVLEHFAADVANCSVMIAPHHGRHSDRAFEFLDVVKPKLTLFGCAPSEHLAYDAWNRRDLDFMTSNQAGNVVLEAESGALRVYIENEAYAAACKADCSKTNEQGYVYMGAINSTAE
jgi:beta-lactamase superfamily II metal-dependent hydrolase